MKRRSSRRRGRCRIKRKTEQEKHFYAKLRFAQSDAAPDIPYMGLWGPATSKESAREVIVRLVRDHGYSEKQLWYYLNKWFEKGWWDYGVSMGVGWFESEAPPHLD